MASNLEVVVRVRDLTTQGLARITQSISRMGSQVLRWGTAFAGISGSLSLVQFTRFASQLEDLEGRLSGVFEGDLDAAATQLERIRALAADPIVGTEELVNTFIQGATAIRGFSEETLNTLANVSVQFDREIGSVFSAFAGASEKSLRTLGVSLQKTGDIVRITSGDMQVQVANTKEAIQQGLIEVWSNRFPDAVEQAGTRFSGAMKIFQDAVEDLGAEIGERILPEITARLNDLTRWVEENDAEIIQFADDAATAIGGFAEQVAGLAASIRDNEWEWRLLLSVGATTALVFGDAKIKLAGAVVLLNQYLAVMNKLPVQGKWPTPPTTIDDDFFTSKREGDTWWPGMDTPATAAPRIPTIPGITATAARSGAAASSPTPKEVIDDWLAGFEDLDAALQRTRDSMDRWANEGVADFSESIKVAFRGVRGEIALTNQDMADFASSVVSDIKTAFTDDFAQGLADMMNGVESFENSWQGAITTVLEGLQQIILKMILMAAYQRFVAPILGGIFGAGTGAAGAASVAGALTAPASFTASAPVVIQPQIVFNAGFVDPSGAEEFFARNSTRFRDIATGAVTEAIDRSPAFRARVRR